MGGNGENAKSRGGRRTLWGTLLTLSAVVLAFVTSIFTVPFFASLSSTGVANLGTSVFWVAVIVMVTVFAMSLTDLGSDDTRSDLSNVAGLINEIDDDVDRLIDGAE